jgi:hypothetical protein
MQLNLKAPVLALASGEILALDDIEGVSIKARVGTLWITQEGAYEDVVLGPGEHFVVKRPGRTVIQAVEPAWISIREQTEVTYH